MKLNRRDIILLSSDYKALCASKDIDAVMVCQPDFRHALVAVTVICSGMAKDGFKRSWVPKAETTGLAEADSLMKPVSRDKFDLRVNLGKFDFDYGKVVSKEWSS